VRKKKSGLSAADWLAEKKERHMPDSKIDFSDIPELTDEELKRAKRVGRPKGTNNKQLIAIRIDPVLLNNIRKMAEKEHKNYQTYIHEILEKAYKKKAA
jgi:predicted DNA binding CopG/RHH family protein